MHQTSPCPSGLVDSSACAVDHLISALADDILESQLDPGDRLPAHRDLAAKLKKFADPSSARSNSTPMP
ncbi:GntR family transcriptional regulator [Pseudomonas sp. GM17]|nr:GntR family transcriptional regulator [Pseudomonas sp. GM17]WIE49863.1 GntR family transcriptional regulator [Pseudomonas sp. GM17]